MLVSPLAAAKKLLETLSGGFSPSPEIAEQIERLMQVLERYSPEELLKAAEFLDATSKTKDRLVAFDAAKAEVAKQPTKEAAPVEVEPAGTEDTAKFKA